jgi:methylmalonyl-CoA/ethylmalonyl-CoA epimerase
MKRLSDAGFQLLNPAPKIGADNKLICFLHPKNTNGVLIELCQTITSTTK